MEKLFYQSFLPPFSSIIPEDISSLMNTVLLNYKKNVKKILKERSTLNWDNLCQPLDEFDNKIFQIWSIISHLNSVNNTSETRVSYRKCLSFLLEFNNWKLQNLNLFKVYKELRNSAEFKTLSQEKKQSIKNILKGFKLSGIQLSKNKKIYFKNIIFRISKLENLFSNNVLDSINSGTTNVINQDKLSGIPSDIISIAKNLAKSMKINGWAFSLNSSTYLSIMRYANNREFRKEIYYAYNTRASDQGPNAGKWDNGDVIAEILSLRHESAKLLGYNNFCEKSLSVRMIKSTKKILNFLLTFLDRIAYKAKKELEDLNKFSKENFNINNLKPWDISYFLEKQKKIKFSIIEKKLRYYFPENSVIDGLFKIVNKIYGIVIKEQYNIEVWHQDVRFFEVRSKNGDLHGSFYLDLYSRTGKQDGAWMYEYRSRMKFSQDNYQRPIAYLICNFNKSQNEFPSFFTHQDVITLFHEFGHVLHHILTEVNVIGVSGINGIPLDVVEVPSQLMENWCWEPKVLSLLSKHYKTGKSFPQSMIRNILKTKRHGIGIFLLRQIELSLFDIKVHSNYRTSWTKTQILLEFQSIKKQISIFPFFEWDRFLNTFSHIFAGSYASGYYSYLLSNIFASNIFSKFSKQGILNQSVGLNFLKHVLSKGGSNNPLVFFKNFLGKNINLNFILKNYDI